MTYREFRDQQRERTRRWLCGELREARSVARAAKRLGIRRTSLYRLLRRHGIEPADVLGKEHSLRYMPRVCSMRA